MRAHLVAILAVAVVSTTAKAAEPVMLYAAGSLRGGERVAEGRVGEMLNRAQLEALYQVPVEKLTDTATGAGAFSPR